VTRTPVQTRCTIALQLLVGARHVLRTLTFWLRPAFVLRAVNRIRRVAGFDRAVALASSALRALIPVAILAGSVLSAVGGKTAAQRIAAG
jgi:predicted ATPase